MTQEQIRRARELRQRQTKAESLLWNVLRGKRLCGKKFRRQHPVPPFFADFACCELKLIVELDGGYHDYQYEGDLDRTAYLERLGWRVVRFANGDVILDVEAVAIAIATTIGMNPEIAPQVPKPSGMMKPRQKERPSES